MPPGDADQRATAPKQWGVSPGTRVWVGGHNVHARREVGKHLTGAVRPPTGPIDVGFIAPRSVDEAVYFADKLRNRLVPDGVIWVIYPKATTQRQTEFDPAPETLVEALRNVGFVESGSAPVSDELLSHRFEPRGD